MDLTKLVDDLLEAVYGAIYHADEPLGPRLGWNRAIVAERVRSALAARPVRAVLTDDDARPIRDVFSLFSLLAHRHLVYRGNAFDPPTKQELMDALSNAEKALSAALACQHAEPPEDAAVEEAKHEENDD